MKLELFKFDSCPYCQRVMGYIEDTKRNDVIFRDILEDEESRKTLLLVGGKEQVPCLFIDGKPLYESSDIIEWLKENPQEA